MPKDRGRDPGETNTELDERDRCLDRPLHPAWAARLHSEPLSLIAAQSTAGQGKTGPSLLPRRFEPGSKRSAPRPPLSSQEVLGRMVASRASMPGCDTSCLMPLLFTEGSIDHQLRTGPSTRNLHTARAKANNALTTTILDQSDRDVRNDLLFLEALHYFSVHNIT